MWYDAAMHLAPPDGLTLLPASALAVMDWQPWDTWIVVTAAVVAMSCALPGVWLVLRQQSMMGDALSHTALPGVVFAFLGVQWLKTAGWLGPEGEAAWQPVVLAGGAVAVGVLTAMMTEAIQKLGSMDASAALGVVFTVLFALGLLLVRLLADDAHIDPDCVLFGQLELVVWDTVSIGGLEVPQAAVNNSLLLAFNLGLMLLFFKELRVAAFDAELATSLGIPAGIVNYLLMGVTAATVVLAFESVGSILVVAILIIPAACAVLWCERLSSLIAVSLGIAAASAVLGHVLAKTVPGYIFGALGMPDVQDAGTPGMMAVACGLLFLGSFLLSPRHGLAGRWLVRGNLVLRMAAEDLLATLYRFEERDGSGSISESRLREETAWISPWTRRWVSWRLRRRGLVSDGGRHVQLTEEGRQRAQELIRGHRLWEVYLNRHFELREDHLHESAHRVEHFLDRELRAQLEDELDSPETDPHGTSIPPG